MCWAALMQLCIERLRLRFRFPVYLPGLTYFIEIPEHGISFASLAGTP